LKNIGIPAGKFNYEVKLRLLDISYNAISSKGLEYFFTDCLP